MEFLSVEELKKLDKEELIEYGHNLRALIMHKVKEADERFEINKLEDILKFLTNSNEFGLLTRKKNIVDSVRSHFQAFNTLMCFHAEEGGLRAVVAHFKSEKYNLMMESSIDIDEIYDIFFTAFKDYSKMGNRMIYSNPEELYKNIDEYIEKFFEPNLNIDKISKVLHLNKDYMMRRYKQQTGNTIQSVIDKKRLREAKKLIFFGVSFTEISYTVGFSSPSVFSRVFKRYENITPREFKNKSNYK